MYSGRRRQKLCSRGGKSTHQAILRPFIMGILADEVSPVV